MAQQVAGPDVRLERDPAQASLLALGVQGLDDYRVPIAWFEKRLAAVPAPPPIYRPLLSRTHWAGFCSAPAGSTRPSPD